MASTASPTMAFEPTPALPWNGNISPPIAAHPFQGLEPRHVGHDRPVKEVHFSPPIASLQPRSKSVATSVPLLEPVSSASTLPTHSQRTKSITSQPNMNAYIEQSRALLEAQRANIEREREQFQAERKLWDAERKMLLSKIADLELRSNKNVGSARRKYSNDTPAGSLQSFRSDISLTSTLSNGRGSRESSTTPNIPPVWETPDMGPVVTRVFSNDNNAPKKIDLHLPSIAEGDMPPSLDGALSPNKLGSPSELVNVSIPIEMLDSTLDGINLKSKALPPSIVAKVISPNASSPHTPSPLSKTPLGDSSSHPVNGLLIPEPTHLRTNAGHTPLAFDGSLGASQTTSDIPTPVQGVREDQSEQHEADTTTIPTRPPHERSNSYFPDVSPPKEQQVDSAGAAEPVATADPNQDPELKGPLTLDSEPQEGEDSAFLQELDMRLLMMAKKIVSSPPESDANEEKDNGKPGTLGPEDEPRLRLKKSSNFGSAFGASDCGFMR